MRICINSTSGDAAEPAHGPCPDVSGALVEGERKDGAMGKTVLCVVDLPGMILVKGKETKGTYVYEEEIGEGGNPPVLKTQYIQKWVLGSNPPAKIKVTIEAA